MIDVFRLIGVTALSANAGKNIVLPIYKSCFKIDKINKCKYNLVVLINYSLTVLQIVKFDSLRELDKKLKIKRC